LNFAGPMGKEIISRLDIFIEYKKVRTGASLARSLVTPSENAHLCSADYQLSLITKMLVDFFRERIMNMFSSQPQSPTLIHFEGGQSYGTSNPTDWKAIATRKQEIREAKLAKYPQWRLPKTQEHDISALLQSRLTPLEQELVNDDATGLLERLALRQVSAVKVLTAYYKVAIAAQDYTNCLTEIFFEEGLQRAEELDEHLRRTGKPIGPLHGLPVSIKDHILVKGHDTSSGYISWAFKTVAEKDAVVVVCIV
jgi:hypothetical protein